MNLVWENWREMLARREPGVGFADCATRLFHSSRRAEDHVLARSVDNKTGGARQSTETRLGSGLNNKHGDIALSHADKPVFRAAARVIYLVRPR